MGDPTSTQAFNWRLIMKKNHIIIIVQFILILLLLGFIFIPKNKEKSNSYVNSWVTQVKALHMYSWKYEGKEIDLINNSNSIDELLTKLTSTYGKLEFVDRIRKEIALGKCQLYLIKKTDKQRFDAPILICIIPKYKKVLVLHNDGIIKFY